MLVSRQAATQPGPSDAGLERSNRLNQSVSQSFIQSFNCAEQWTCRRAYLSPQVLFFANVKLALFSSLSVCLSVSISFYISVSGRPISYQIIITRFFTRMFAPFPRMSITYHLVFRSTTARTSTSRRPIQPNFIAAGHRRLPNNERSLLDCSTTAPMTMMRMRGIDRGIRNRKIIRDTIK